MPNCGPHGPQVTKQHHEPAPRTPLQLGSRHAGRLWTDVHKVFHTRSKMPTSEPLARAKCKAAKYNFTSARMFYIALDLKPRKTTEDRTPKPKAKYLKQRTRKHVAYNRRPHTPNKISATLNVSLCARTLRSNQARNAAKSRAVVRRPRRCCPTDLAKMTVTVHL